MISARTQPPLATADGEALMPPTFEPLLTIEAVRRELKDFGYDEEDVMDDVDGCFEWAFDISARKSRRREVRVFAPCVEQRRRQLLNPKWNVRRFTFEEVLRGLFPNRNPRRPWVSSSPDVRLAFVCSPDLIIDLVDDKELLQMPGTEYRRGEGGAAQITWESITRFLTKRRIG